MARTNKKTRIRGLPPRLQLDHKDNISGSRPPIRRTASDSRNGYATISFDDTKTVVFPTGTIDIYHGVNIPLDSQYLYLATDLTTSLTGTGKARKGITDTIIEFADTDSAYIPFHEEDKPEVSAKETNNPFYATGSSIAAVGEGFSQPLWDKTRFEIDITPSAQHSTRIRNYLSTSANFPMCYWNKDTRMFEGIGSGKEFDAYLPVDEASAKLFLEEQCIGFRPSIFTSPATVATAQSKGVPVTTCAFPHHIKFHATSSNLISMEQYIHAPFLVEKVVLICSATYSASNYYMEPASLGGDCSITTFFVLNQRQMSNVSVNKKVFTDDDVTYINVSTQIPSASNNIRDGLYIKSIRDIVSYLQVSMFNTTGSVQNKNKIDLYGREYNIFKEYNGEHYWTRKLILSGVAKSIIQTKEPGLTKFFLNWSSANQYTVIDAIEHSGRNLAGQSAGRDFLNTFELPAIVGTDTIGGTVISVPVRQYKQNPYVLLPTDQLILGWQLPICQRINVTTGNEAIYDGLGDLLEWAPVPSKIIFYGSYAQNNKEAHDTTNQMLTSEAVNEVIE